MKIDFHRFLALACLKGISFVSLGQSETRERSVSVHNGEVESQQIGTSSRASFKGIKEGKLGVYSTDSLDETTPDTALDAITETSSFGKEDKEDNYFSGKGTYIKAKTLRDDFLPSNLKDRRRSALSLCETIRKRDKRIQNVDVSLSMVYENGEKKNSLGLNCQEGTKYFSGSRYISAVDEDGNVRNSDEGTYSRISLDDLIEELKGRIGRLLSFTMDFFHSVSLPSGSYPCVFSKERASILLNYYRGQLSAKQVQKHLSIFEGKLNKKIRSDQRTVLHTPHIEYRGAASYDADGCPTEDFPVINKGRLKTYFYSLESAHEEKRESNGCSIGDGEGGPCILTVEKGKKSLQDLFMQRKNGIYLTELKGLNSGIDGQSRQFSLPCSGYIIKDGKKDKAFDRNIVSGNLADVFRNVLALSDDSKIVGGNLMPDRLVSSVDLSGNEDN